MCPRISISIMTCQLPALLSIRKRKAFDQHWHYIDCDRHLPKQLETNIGKDKYLPMCMPIQINKTPHKIINGHRDL